MSLHPTKARTPTLRQLEELPGVGDVVWSTVTRLANAPAPICLLFTAAESRAGTTALAAATAIGLARHQRVPVCLVETSVRRPALAGYLGLAGAGLSDVLDGRVECESCLQELHGCPGLFVLTGGTAREPVSGEFTTGRLIETFALLEQRCHYLVLDVAPVLDHVESRLLLRYADAAVLVLRARSTLRSDAERAHDMLVASGTPVLGSIFNDYQADNLFGSGRRADRKLMAGARTERVPASAASLPPWEDAAAVAVAGAPTTYGDSHVASNGGQASLGGESLPEPQATDDSGSSASQRRQIDILERRIVKLNQLLAQTEAELQRMALLKNVDLGIASIYRGVQGLCPEDKALMLKKALMKKIFYANMELKSAIARHA